MQCDLTGSGESAPDYTRDPTFDPTFDPTGNRYGIPPSHGRGMVQRLHVHYIEERESMNINGEERVEGVDLGALVARSGPLGLGTAQELATTINDARDALEKQAGASPPRPRLIGYGVISHSRGQGFIRYGIPSVPASPASVTPLVQPVATAFSGVRILGQDLSLGK